MANAESRSRPFTHLLSFVGPYTQAISRWINVFKTASAWKRKDLLRDLSSSSNHSISGGFQVGCEQNRQSPCRAMVRG